MISYICKGVYIMSSNRLNYITKYNKENYKMYQFRIKKTDAILIEKLDNISNRNSYITNLILDDIDLGVLTLKEIKEKIKPIIEKYNINDVYLFGSYARGEANRNSDIDIYCERGNIDTLWKKNAFKDELEEVLNKEVDIVTIGSEMDEYFKNQLEEDMIKIW